MKIAQIAPLYESVPPRLYGGTERVVAYLVDALVDLGHDVTLFASGDSRTRAKLVKCREKAIWLDEHPYKSENAAHLSMLNEVRKRAHEFDILHFHVDLLPYPLFEGYAGKLVTTMHGRLDIEDLKEFYQRWPDYPLVSISDSQRTPLSFAHWAGTIYHGLPLNRFTPRIDSPQSYLAFLGRLAPEKQPEVAIKLAQRLGKNIRIAAKIEPHNACYFRETIKPLLEDPGVKFLGELGDDEKNDFLGNAEALLFPVAWPEPFGVVMIEAMACGTPVIAWNCGSVPEIIEHGVTGFIVNNDEEAAEAVRKVAELDRGRIRKEFERRFSATDMAKNYVSLYKEMTGREAAVPVTGSETPETVTVESEDSTMPYNLLALKHMDTFIVANSMGDISGKGDGLFRNDTRVLSQYRLLMGDKPLSLLSGSLSSDDVYFNSHITNRPLPPLGDRSIPEGVIHIDRSRFLWKECMYERLQLVNYGEREVIAPLEVHFAADFRDIFEVRGIKRKAYGQILDPVTGENHVILGYRGLDDLVRKSAISFSQAPRQLSSGTAEFVFTLPRNTCVELYIEVSPDYKKPPTRDRYRWAAAQARRSMRRRRNGGGVIKSGEHIFNSWLEKSRSDLALLTTELPTGPYPYAGIPWFSTPFGRDAVITAMQMLWFDPRIARGVLAFLASHQAEEFSSFRDAAPGKIMHETRKGEMSRLNEVPFSLYYGGVDTTPLFVMLAGAYADRTADLDFIEEIWPALEDAMVWIEQVTDSDGDGFLGYASGEATGLRNQGWKDSEDSVFHANGEFPQGPIALVEVQGYKFAALKAMAKLSKRRGNGEAAERWRACAEAIREAVERRYWMEESGFYALALDGAGEACRVRASNAGHLLFVGLPTPERAYKVTQQLLSSSFDSGWGVRTLATDEVRYNPMSYHNGSVWPHDTAICAAGIARYGERTGAAKILSELFGAAVHFGMRLPELFCGFQRLSSETPIAYPVACLPQAWSSGSVFMTLQACLGVTIDAWRNEIRVEHPELPNGINQVVLKGITLGDAQVNLVFQRVRDRVTVFTEGEAQSKIKILTFV